MAAPAHNLPLLKVSYLTPLDLLLLLLTLFLLFLPVQLFQLGWLHREQLRQQSTAASLTPSPTYPSTEYPSSLTPVVSPTLPPPPFTESSLDS